MHGYNKFETENEAQQSKINKGVSRIMYVHDLDFACLQESQQARQSKRQKTDKPENAAQWALRVKGLAEIDLKSRETPLGYLTLKDVSRARVKEHDIVAVIRQIFRKVPDDARHSTEFLVPGNNKQHIH
jgi:hypothetical protein